MDTNHTDSTKSTEPLSSVPPVGQSSTSSIGAPAAPAAPSHTAFGPVSPPHIEPPHQEHPMPNGKSPEQPPQHHKGVPPLLVILLLVLAFFGGLLLATWYFQNQLQKVTPVAMTAPQPTSVPKTIVIGTDATFQPMEYLNKQNEMIGYDIDLGNRIADELGTKIEYKNIPWDNLFTALDNKQVDVILSAVTITDDRKVKYDFSDPYLNAGQVIITTKDNTTIASASGLQGKRIAVQEGTTNEKEALKYTAPNLVIKFPDFLQATQALVNGQADAILSDLPGAKGTVTANPTLKIASDPFTNEYYGVVFRKGDPEVKEINKALTILQTKGVLTDLKQKWLD